MIRCNFLQSSKKFYEVFTPRLQVKYPIATPKKLWGTGMGQWGERSLPTNVSRVRLPDPASFVGWVCCWFSTLLRERFFSGYSGFPLSLRTNISKFQFDSGMHGDFWTSSCKLLGAPWVNKLYIDIIIFHPVEWRLQVKNPLTTTKNYERQLHCHGNVTFFYSHYFKHLFFRRGV